MPSLGPDCYYCSILFPYCCPAQGPQISPSRENAWNPGQRPVQKPRVLLPTVKVVLRMSEVGLRFGSVHAGVTPGRGGPTRSSGCCQRGLSLHGFDPTVIKTRNEEMGPGYQPSSYLLVLATCPRENWGLVPIVSVRLWEVISFPAKRAYKL